MEDNQPYVICRCTAAGVHAGFLVSRNGDEVRLRDSRRLHYWRVPMGAPAFLSGVAVAGLDNESRIGCPINVTLTEVCEIIECTDVAAKSIQEIASHDRSR